MTKMIWNSKSKTWRFGRKLKLAIVFIKKTNLWINNAAIINKIIPIIIIDDDIAMVTSFNSNETIFEFFIAQVAIISKNKNWNIINKNLSIT